MVRGAPFELKGADLLWVFESDLITSSSQKRVRRAAARSARCLERIGADLFAAFGAFWIRNPGHCTSIGCNQKRVFAAIRRISVFCFHIHRRGYLFPVAIQIFVPLLYLYFSPGFSHRCAKLAFCAGGWKESFLW
jgi:hypothetical protein